MLCAGSNANNANALSFTTFSHDRRNLVTHESCCCHVDLPALVYWSQWWWAREPLYFQKQGGCVLASPQFNHHWLSRTSWKDVLIHREHLWATEIFYCAGRKREKIKTPNFLALPLWSISTYFMPNILFSSESMQPLCIYF